MRRKSRDYVGEIAQNVDMSGDLVRQIDEFCEKRGVKKKQVYELALRRFLAQEAGRAR